MTWDQMRQSAFELQRLFDRRNTRLRGRPWSRQEILMGLATDVGDLIRFAMMVDGRKDAPSDIEPRQMLAGELSDCLWSLIVLAREYNVDLETEFDSTMSDLIATFTREDAAN